MKKFFEKIFIEKTENTKIQFFRYVFVGGFAAVINISMLYILTDWFNVYYLISNIIAFISGLIVNYIISKKLIFTNKVEINKMIEFIIYGIIGVIGLALDLLFMWIGVSKLEIYYLISKIISTGLVFIWNFLARKFLYVFINKSSLKG